VRAQGRPPGSESPVSKKNEGNGSRFLDRRGLMATTKRGRREGTIGRLPNGRWWGRVDLGWVNGKRKRKAVYGKTRAEVSAKLTRQLRDQQQGLPPAEERQTLGQFLERWLDQVARPSVREATMRSYEDAVRLHIAPALGHVRLFHLTPQHLQTWIGERLKNNASPQSCAYARRVLRAALTQAVRWGMIVRNPASLVDDPRFQKREIRPLTPEQARHFLKTASGHRLEALFSVALALGLRQGEALGLTWENVDLEIGEVRIRQALQRVGGDRKRLRASTAERRRLVAELRVETDPARQQAIQAEMAREWETIQETRRKFSFVEPKSFKSRRTVSLPGVVVAALRQHRVRQLEDRLTSGAQWQDSGLVFTSKTGSPVDPRRATREFHHLLEKANLPSIRFHDLRHTAASLLLAQGVNPRTIMETLGHSQISLTLNTYSHVMPAMQRDAADRMDEVLTATGVGR